MQNKQKKKSENKTNLEISRHTKSANIEVTKKTEHRNQHTKQTQKSSTYKKQRSANNTSMEFRKQCKQQAKQAYKSATIFCNQNYALHCPCMYNVILVFGIGFRRAVFQRFGANFVGNLMRKMKMDVQSFSLLFAF